MTIQDKTHCNIEEIARASHGKLVAYLAARFRDLALAEESVSTAFIAALESWPTSGIPQRPEAWLYRTAYNKLIDHLRQQKTADKHEVELTWLAAGAEDTNTPDIFKDERLKLLFICAHPALDSAIHAPLMLQTVLGLNVQKIAQAYVIPESAMAQRLVRAKQKIKANSIPFVMPAEEEIPSRLSSVLNAIYACYGVGWDLTSTEQNTPDGLAEEAIYLAKIITDLQPEDAEAKGLLALFLFCQARQAAQRDARGDYIPLDKQDKALWDASMLAQAEKILFQAAAQKRLGRFQLEAAIQSAHVARLIHAPEKWDGIFDLYEGLLVVAPSIGAVTSYAASLITAGKIDKAMVQIEKMDPEKVTSYSPYWSVYAQALKKSGQIAKAEKYFQLAIGLTTDPARRRYLQEQMSAPA